MPWHSCHSNYTVHSASECTQCIRVYTVHQSVHSASECTQYIRVHTVHHSVHSASECTQCIRVHTVHQSVHSASVYTVHQSVHSASTVCSKCYRVVTVLPWPAETCSWCLSVNLTYSSRGTCCTSSRGGAGRQRHAADAYQLTWRTAVAALAVTNDCHYLQVSV